MTSQTNFKVCICCGTQVSLRKRNCPRCNVPALWREPTVDEVTARNAERAALEKTLRSLLDAKDELVGSANVLVKATQRSDVHPSNLANYRGRFSVAQTNFDRAMADVSAA